jgi:hypothetical protein
MHAILALLVGVLNFAPGDPGLEYAVKPTAAELSTLGGRLAHDLRTQGAPEIANAPFRSGTVARLEGAT